MKKLISFVAALAVILNLFGLFHTQSAIALNLTQFAPASTFLAAEAVEEDLRNPADAKLAGEYGQKIDLNNANVRLFRQYRGFYPTLAKKIVDNAPYQKVEDVLDIAGLSDRQKSLLQAQFDNFTVTPPADVFNEGGDRYNPGYY